MAPVRDLLRIASEKTTQSRDRPSRRADDLWNLCKTPSVSFGSLLFSIDSQNFSSIAWRLFKKNLFVDVCLSRLLKQKYQ